jgi:carbamoyltransferase
VETVVVLPSLAEISVNVPRSTIPAVTHVDYSARIQTVDPERSPLYARLLRAFEARTGCPMLVNTSFNVRGEPIVGSPADAYRCFQATHLDVLALGRCVLRKEQQKALTEAERQAHVAQFGLD